jgi:hypothetical protein
MSVLVICGGEPESVRHERVESEKMDHVAKSERRERYSDPIIIRGEADYRYAIESLERELKAAWGHVERLRRNCKCGANS